MERRSALHLFASLAGRGARNPGHSPYGAPPRHSPVPEGPGSTPGRASWDAGEPCPSPASSSQGGPSAARAGPRGRPSACLRGTPAGTDPDPTSSTSRDAPLVDRDAANIRAPGSVRIKDFEIIPKCARCLSFSDRCGSAINTWMSFSTRGDRKIYFRHAGLVPANYVIPGRERSSRARNP
jgi:hypothetical protein